MPQVYKRRLMTAKLAPRYTNFSIPWHSLPVTMLCNIILYMHNLGNRSEYYYNFSTLWNLSPESYKFDYFTCIMWPNYLEKCKNVIFQHCYWYVLLFVHQSWYMANQPSWPISPVDYLICVVIACVPCTNPGCGGVAAATGWNMDWIQAEHHGWDDRTVA